MVRDRRKRGGLFDDEDTDSSNTGIDLSLERSVEKLDELMKRAEPMLEQVNGLYNQYLAGVLKAPPNERRQTLDQIMNTLMAMNKPTPTYRFRYVNLASTYNTYRQKWEKLLKDIEKGIIKRRLKST